MKTHLAPPVQSQSVLVHILTGDVEDEVSLAGVIVEVAR